MQIDKEVKIANQAMPVRTKSTFIAIFGIILVATNLRAPLTVVGPLIGHIQADTALSATMLGFLTALPVLAFAFFSPWASTLAARYGMEHLLFLSMVVLTIGMLLRSVPSILALFAGTAILGTAIAIANVLLPSLIKRDFPHKLGLLTGIYSTSMALLAAFASGLGVPLAEKLDWGWRGALSCWAVLSVIAIFVWLPRRKSKQKLSSLKQQDVSIKQLLRSGLAWQVSLFMGFQSVGFYTVIAWLPEIVHSKGIALSTAGWLLFIMQFVSMFAMFIMPILATRRSSQHSLVVLTAVILIGGYLGFFGNSLTLFVISAILAGTGQGASLGLALSFFGLRAANANQAALLSGMAQSIGYFIAALGPLIFGLLYDWTSSWNWPLIGLILSTLLMLIVGLGASRDLYVGPREVEWQR